MTIYSLFIFDRHCNCIYSREWNVTKNTLQSSPQQKQKDNGTINEKNETDSAKLLFGAIFSLRNIAIKLGNTSNYMKTFATTKYRVHYYETASGLKFCLLTDPSIDDMQYVLREIYTKLYLENVVKNALSPIDFQPGEMIENDNFIRGVDNFIESISSFV